MNKVIITLEELRRVVKEFPTMTVLEYIEMTKKGA